MGLPHFFDYVSQTACKSEFLYLLLSHRFHKIIFFEKLVIRFLLPHRGNFVDTSNFEMSRGEKKSKKIEFV